MGLSSVATTKDPDSEEALLLSYAATPTAGTTISTYIPTLPPYSQVPKDSFHLAYIIYFTLGAGFLLPWNAFITAVDYFSYLYPDASVDRVFALCYMLVALFCVNVIVFYAHKSNAFLRVNVGLVLFMVSLLVVPTMDLVYIKGIKELYSGYYVTVAAIGLSGVALCLVQGGVVGSAGELPNKYMQAMVAGTAASASPTLWDSSHLIRSRSNSGNLGDNCRCVGFIFEDHNQIHIFTRCVWSTKKCKPLFCCHYCIHGNLHYFLQFSGPSPDYQVLQSTQNTSYRG